MKPSECQMASKCAGKDSAFRRLCTQGRWEAFESRYPPYHVVSDGLDDDDGLVRVMVDPAEFTTQEDL